MLSAPIMVLADIRDTYVFLPSASRLEVCFLGR